MSLSRSEVLAFERLVGLFVLVGWLLRTWRIIPFSTWLITMVIVSPPTPNDTLIP